MSKRVEEMKDIFGSNSEVPTEEIDVKGDTQATFLNSGSSNGRNLVPRDFHEVIESVHAVKRRHRPLKVVPVEFRNHWQ